MLKIMLAAVVAFVLVGCGAFQQKADRYEDAARMAINPEQIEVYYRRDGNEAGFYERRCSGDPCAMDLDAFVVPLDAGP